MEKLIIDIIADTTEINSFHKVESLKGVYGICLSLSSTEVLLDILFS
jgi:uncharacterized protein (UPF0262 family)